MIHAKRSATLAARGPRALDLAEFLRRRCADRLRAVRRRLSDHAQMDPGADRLRPDARHHRRADQPASRRRTGGCRAQQARRRERRIDRRHYRRAAAGDPADANCRCMVAQSLHAFSSCVLTPAIAAISLHLVGHAALGERLGRNARFASIGNGLAAAVMGATGAYLSSQRGVPADGGAVRTRAVGAAGNRPRAACAAADHDPAVRLAGAAAIVRRPATADVRCLRAAVPPVQCRDAAAGRCHRHDARGRLTRT